MARYLIDPATPDDLPVLIGAHTGERIGAIPLFGLVEADLRGRRLNPCDASCRVELEPVLAGMGLTLKDLCSRPRGPQKPQKPVEVAPLASHGLSAEIVEAGSRRLMLQAAIPEELITAALPEIVGARLKQPDHTVLCAFTSDRWTLGATKKVASGVRSLEKAVPRAAIVEFSPLTVADPDEQAHNVEALMRLASVTTDATLTRDGQDWPVIAGAQTTVLVADASGLQRLPARYVLAPFGAILPSNDPENFAPSVGYPTELQERDYRTDQHERLKVIKNGDNWESALVLNSNPDAVNGPPITDAEGRVLGGNSRAMSMMRYAARNPQQYAAALRLALRNHCAAFGLEGVRADLERMMLVRVVEGVTDPRTISRALNRSLTLELGKGASSVTLGKLIPVSVLEQLAADVSDATLREILRDKSDAIISALRGSGFITAQNSPIYVTRSNELTTRAVQDIEDALVGLVVQSTDLYNLLRPKLLQLITRVAPALLAIESFAAYAEDIADARAALVDANAWLGLPEAELLRETNTVSMFGETERLSLSSPHVARWCLWWMQAARGPVIAARCLDELVRMAQKTAEGPDMFGGGTRDAAAMIEALDMQLFTDHHSVIESWREYIEQRIPFRPLSPQPSLFGRRGNPSYVPPMPVRQAAARALDVRASKPPSQRGGTPVGLARARDLSHGRPVSVETAQRMARYFARHEGDKQGASWSERGKGWQAWNMWGGDAGRAWADDVVRRDNPPDHNNVDLFQASSELDVINADMRDTVGACYVSRDWKQARFSHAFRNLHHAAFNVALFMHGATFEYKEVGDNTAIGLFLLPEKVEIAGRGEYNQRLFALYMRDLLLRFARAGSEARRGITRAVRKLPDMTERFSQDYADELPTMRCMRLAGVEALLVWPWFPMEKGTFQYQDAALFFRPEAHSTDVERFRDALQEQTGVDLSLAAREREAAARDLILPSQLKLLLPLNGDLFAAFDSLRSGFTPEERKQVFLEHALEKHGRTPTLNARVAITLPGKTQLVRYDLLQVLYMKVRGVRDNIWAARFKRSTDHDVQHVPMPKPAAPEIAPEPVAASVAAVSHQERVFGPSAAPAPTVQEHTPIWIDKPLLRSGYLYRGLENAPDRLEFFYVESVTYPHHGGTLKYFQHFVAIALQDIAAVFNDFCSLTNNSNAESRKTSFGVLYAENDAFEHERRLKAQARVHAYDWIDAICELTARDVLLPDSPVREANVESVARRFYAGTRTFAFVLLRPADASMQRETERDCLMIVYCPQGVTDVDDLLNTIARQGRVGMPDTTPQAAQAQPVFVSPTYCVLRVSPQYASRVVALPQLEPLNAPQPVSEYYKLATIENEAVKLNFTGLSFHTGITLFYNPSAARERDKFLLTTAAISHDTRFTSPRARAAVTQEQHDVPQETARASASAAVQTLPERIAPTTATPDQGLPDFSRALKGTPAATRGEPAPAKRTTAKPERTTAKPERTTAKPERTTAKAERKRADDDGPRALQRTEKRSRRQYTAEDIPDDQPRDPRTEEPVDMRAIRPQVVRSVLRGVGVWASQHDDPLMAEMGPILLALADELRLAQAATRRDLPVSDQMFAHMYWAAHNPADQVAYAKGLIGAAQAAILVAQGKPGQAAAWLQPKRRPNPIPVWAETLLQLARLVTALSAASAAGVGLNSAALGSDTLLPPDDPR